MNIVHGRLRASAFGARRGTTRTGVMTNLLLLTLMILGLLVGTDALHDSEAPAHAARDADGGIRPFRVPLVPTTRNPSESR